MRNYKQELENRVQFIRDLLKSSGAKGVVYGNSGGKDSALVGILAKKACDDTVGIIMPCAAARNYKQDYDDAMAVADKFGIETKVIDITDVRNGVINEVGKVAELSDIAIVNIAPRIRMTALYAYAAAEHKLVAGTGNKSERFVGYFTKWGDGACDFNPIADLTVDEVYEFLEYLGCPQVIIDKAPSAALFDGQTDEDDMGFKYSQLDEYLKTGVTEASAMQKIERMHRVSEHKRTGAKLYGE